MSSGVSVYLTGNRQPAYGPVQNGAGNYSGSYGAATLERLKAVVEP